MRRRICGQAERMCLAVIAVALAACAAADAQVASLATRAATQGPSSAGGHKAGEIVIEQASMELAGKRVEYELGTLYVPENRAEPKSRIIGVGFARIKAAPAATGTTPAASSSVTTMGNATATGSASAPTGTATFVLPGGPGFSFLTGLKGHMPHLLRYRAAGDVVVIDQRGFSQRGDVLTFARQSPPEPLDEPGSLARSTDTFAGAARDAVAEFAKKGIDLRGYNVKECAEDVNDLRKALGYEKINLVGVSFGSQWSFAVMRLRPEIVARALLSGVEPLDYGYDMPSGVMATLRRSWKLADKDKALAPYLPAGGVEASLKAVVERFERGPVSVKVKDKGGDEATLKLGIGDLQRDLPRNTQTCPAFILALYHERYDDWAKAVLARRRGGRNDVRLIGPLIDTSLGVTPGRLKQLNGDPATRFLGQWNWHAYVATADIWPTPDVGDDFRTAVETQVPVLFVQGDWDTNTPVENAIDIVKSFPKGRLVIVEQGPHNLLEQIAQRYPKEWERIVGFLGSGTMPDLPARLTLPAPKFAIPSFPPPPTTRREGGE